jgi:hypothetical protein
MVLSEKKGIHCYFCFLRSNVYHATNMHLNYAFLVCFKYKCLEIPYNKLFINLACLVFTEKYRTLVFLYKPRPTGSVCTRKSSIRYFSVKTSRSVNKKLIF